MRRALASNPDATIEELQTALKRHGISKARTTISSIRADFRGCYRALEAVGALK
jgi:hypothetical protein